MTKLFHTYFHPGPISVYFSLLFLEDEQPVGFSGESKKLKKLFLRVFPIIPYQWFPQLFFSHSPPSAKSRSPFCRVPCAHYPMPHSHFLIHNSILNLGFVFVKLHYITYIKYYTIILLYNLFNYIELRM